MVYHPRSVRILGVAQLVIGTAMFFFGILSIVIVPYWSSYIGCGLWIGLWVGLTGLFGYLGARSNSDPNKCLIGTMIGFAVTSCVLAGVMLIIYAIALSEFARRLRCPQDVYPTRHYWDYGYSECDRYNRYNYHYRNYLSYSKAQAGAGLGSLLIILAVVEFFVALASSIYGCNACCCTGTPGQTQPPVTYYPQPGGVIVVNPTGGAAVAPGPAVQNFTTYPGVIQPQQGYIIAPQGYPVQQYPAGVAAGGAAAGGAAAGTQQPQQPQQAFQNKQVEMPPPYNAAAQ